MPLARQLLIFTTAVTTLTYTCQLYLCPRHASFPDALPVPVPVPVYVFALFSDGTQVNVAALKPSLGPTLLDTLYTVFYVVLA